MNDAVRDVLLERGRQVDMGFDAGDGQHSPSDWVALIARCSGLAIDDGTPGTESERFRRQMVRTAALALAAIEAFDRKAVKVAGLPTESRGPGY